MALYRFFTTTNRKWFPVSAPPAQLGTEREVLYSWIAAKPGISNEELQERWRFKANLSSRLKELEDKGHIKGQRIGDLFNEEQQ